MQAENIDLNFVSRFIFGSNILPEHDYQIHKLSPNVAVNAERIQHNPRLFWETRCQSSAKDWHSEWSFLHIALPYTTHKHEAISTPANHGLEAIWPFQEMSHFLALFVLIEPISGSTHPRDFLQHYMFWNLQANNHTSKSLFQSSNS